MELVYLWVEEYKNIKEQGFNFSPRFECEYEDGNLTITPKEYIENFFDEKAKNNLLEFLTRILILFSEKKTKNSLSYDNILDVNGKGLKC